ncbi:Acyl carrier protein 2, mitochondrial [Dendrobium catenatum]|uniref:Acyl carrier protein n=1 Tax=Dendrobium catenatum TaxID=906689 RepID=A0A2I0VLH1_9ASPA|nr:Acyl carrier protein 2, mitochondrial [Dendrobium catenatum]
MRWRSWREKEGNPIWSLSRGRIEEVDMGKGMGMEGRSKEVLIGNVGRDIMAAKVTPKANFQTDLGLDSLDTVEVVMALEEEFGFEIPDNEADKISSINDAVDFIASHPQAK